MSDTVFSELWQRLGGLPGEQVDSFNRTADEAYQQLENDEADVFVDFNRIIRSGQPNLWAAEPIKMPATGSLRPVLTDISISTRCGYGKRSPAEEIRKLAQRLLLRRAI